MPERYDRILRMVCIALAAVLVYQVARVFIRHSPVARLSIPQLPTLPEKTNAVAEVKGTNGAPAKMGGKKGTNSEAMAGKSGTNVVVVKKDKDTNAVPEKMATNVTVVVADAVKTDTNPVVVAKVEKKGTNAISSGDFGTMATNATNLAMLAKNGTNKIAGTNAMNGTNGMTNVVSAKGKNNAGPGGMAMGRRGGMGMFGQGGGEKLPDLPALTQARIDKIIVSEIMVPLMRGQPTALIGIAGSGAMLRAASGQSGYVKEGGKLGDITLLKVGVNRVLVDEGGEKKELTIFSGIGGETLLPKTGDTNEITKKTP